MPRDIDLNSVILRVVVFLSAILLVVGSANMIISGNTRLLVQFNVIVADVAIGLYILFQNRKSSANRAFCALSIYLAFWSYAAQKFIHSSLLSTAMIWGKLVFVGPAVAAPIFYYFTFVFPRKTDNLSGTQKILMFILPLSAIAALPTDLILKDVVLSEGRLVSVFGMGYSFMLAYFIIYVGYGIANMLGKYNSSIGGERMQARYLLFGVTASAVCAGITSVVFPWFGEFRFISYSPLFTIIFLATTAYSIGVTRLVSLEFMMQKSLIYIVISSILTLFYVLAGLASGQPLEYILGDKTIFAFMIFALFASIIYQPVYRYILELSDRMLYGGKYNYQKTLLNMSHGITSVIKLSELIRLIVSTFLDNIKVKEMSVLLYDENRSRFKSTPCDLKTAGKYKRIEFDAAGPIAAYLSTKKDILVKDEVESEIGRHPSLSSFHSLRDELEKLGMAVWIPVISKDKLIAIICLGHKVSGDMYTDEDIGLLKILANQIAVSFDNSMMYSTISRQYDELKKANDKLDEADKLASLGTMAAGMAHEIKNPLSSMKVFSQLLHDRYEDADFRKKFEEIIPKEISRIDRIVEGLLSFARSPEMKLSQVNIQEMIEEILADLNEDIERGNIKVQKKFNPVPNIQADRDQLFRAFANIILNAIQAMPSGGQLDLVLEADKLSKFVTAKIADTGQGISKEQLKHIFDPFFTTKHYGTGLGLTISHSIIDKHRGGIDIQSESSKGTTVTVTLPVS